MAQLLTTAQAAERLQLGKRTVERLISDGALPVVRIGRSVRIAESALAAFVRQCTSEPAVEKASGPLTNRQRAAIHARSGAIESKAKVPRRSVHDALLARASQEFGRTIESVSELDVDEASWCLDILDDDPGALLPSDLVLGVELAVIR